MAGVWPGGHETHRNGRTVGSRIRAVEISMIAGQWMGIRPKSVWWPARTWLPRQLDLESKVVLDFGAGAPSHNWFAQEVHRANRGGQPFDVRDLRGRYYGYDRDARIEGILREVGIWHDPWDGALDGRIDIVWSSWVHEHLCPEDRAEFLRLAHRLLRPAGWLYLAFPNMANLNAINMSHDPEHRPLAPLYEIWRCAEAGFEVESFYFGLRSFGPLLATPFMLLANRLLGFPPQTSVFVRGRKAAKPSDPVRR